MNGQDGGAANGGGAGIPNMMAMGPNEIAMLANLMRGSATKLRRMTQATPAAWMEYKRHFLTVAALNHWDDLRMRRELAAGMQEKAGNAVFDIDPGEAGITLEDLITAYEERFMPAAAGQTARKNYQSSRQLSTESAREWHTRVRELFNLAYPGEDPNDQAHCLDTYTNGLNNATVKFYVSCQPLDNFQQALSVAERAETANRDTSSGSRLTGITPEVNAMGSRPPSSAPGAGQLSCYFCMDAFRVSSPHPKSLCPYFKAVRQMWQADQQPSRPAPNPSRGRGGRRGGGGGGKSKKSLNSVEVPEDQLPSVPSNEAGT